MAVGAGSRLVRTISTAREPPKVVDFSRPTTPRITRLTPCVCTTSTHSREKEFKSASTQYSYNRQPTLGILHGVS